MPVITGHTTITEIVEDGRRKALAERILHIAARRSTETMLGWAHPDCEALQEAARIVRGDPLVAAPEINDGVLSAGKPRD